MRSWRALVIGLVTLALGVAALTGARAAARPGPGRPRGRARPARAPGTPRPARPAAGQPAAAARDDASPAPATAAADPGTCTAFPGAHQLTGADGVTPAAWSGGGLTVPACGPVPGDAGHQPLVYAYPGAPWTAGYQCVEFSERYLYQRFGITMGAVTNGDQVAAHYAAAYPGLFLLVRNGTPGRAPAAGDVLSLSDSAGFHSASGGHTAVVQASSVDAAGDGTVTIVEENATAAGVAVLPVTGWSVSFPGFRYLEWLAPAGLAVTAPHPPAARAGHPYRYRLTAAGGTAPYRWRIVAGPLPAGLALAPDGELAGTPRPGTAETGGARALTVGVTDARGATATATVTLPVSG